MMRHDDYDGWAEEARPWAPVVVAALFVLLAVALIYDQWPEPPAPDYGQHFRVCTATGAEDEKAFCYDVHRCDGSGCVSTTKEEEAKWTRTP